MTELTNRYDNITSANLVLTKVLAFVQLFKPELDLMREKTNLSIKFNQ